MEEVYKSDDRNLLLVTCHIDQRSLLLAGVYGPNANTPLFSTNLEERIEWYTQERVIICGDFNVTLNHHIDNENYIEVRNQNSRKS